jgi:predicted  nucleic acid-binding Zn-ribbon protein
LEKEITEAEKQLNELKEQLAKASEKGPFEQIRDLAKEVQNVEGELEKLYQQLFALHDDDDLT